MIDGKQQALVVGYGSIGTRHARVLGDLGLEVAVVTKRRAACPHHPVFDSLEEALRGVHPHYVVVANPTSEHLATLETLVRLNYRGLVLVEKPLYSDATPPIAHSFARCAVGYNLRFHPALRALRARLADETIHSVQAYVGQYLPSWRPGRDYRTTSSASVEAGGGVLRDLSHELDLLHWLFGELTVEAAIGGKVSSLEIATDDLCVALLHSERCKAISLQMNYLDRLGRREICVVTESNTFALDLIRGELRDKDGIDMFDAHGDDTYRFQHRAMLSGDDVLLCTLAEATVVAQLIEEIESARK